MAAGIHCDGFDVADSSPRLVTEPDLPSHDAGVADELSVVVTERVHASVGVISVIVTEAATEGPIPQDPQRHSSRPVDLVTAD
ncbi:MAG: hypothetical protein KGQ66_21555, partial [Acidobacteriota bacterium]|nr:hypothetical protein [Acidobacteriota bacterium]